MCPWFAAPALGSALRNSCWRREGHPASPQSSEIPQVLPQHRTCLVMSPAPLLAAATARGWTPTLQPFRPTGLPPSHQLGTLKGLKWGRSPQGLSSSRQSFPSPPASLRSAQYDVKVVNNFPVSSRDRSLSHRHGQSGCHGSQERGGRSWMRWGGGSACWASPCCGERCPQAHRRQRRCLLQRVPMEGAPGRALPTTPCSVSSSSSSAMPQQMAFPFAS